MRSKLSVKTVEAGCLREIFAETLTSAVHGAVTIHTSAEGPSYPLNDSCTGAVVHCG